MRAFIAILSLFLVAATAGCANQYRDVDPEITGEQVLQLLNKAGEAGASSVGDMQAALTLANSAGVTIYFSDGGGPFGGVANVLSLVEFKFLGDDYADLSIWDFSDVQVFFMDRVTAQGRESALILGMQKKGQEGYRYYAFTGASDLSDGEFVAELQSGGQTKLIFNSLDVEGDELLEVIQLRVYNSDQQEIGKIPTLIGFGG